MDLMAACTGFVYGLMVADAWVRGTGQTVLLIGANVLSRRVNPSDLQTACLFGDAAGAVVLAPAAEAGIVATVGQSAGEHAGELILPAGGSRRPWGPELAEAERYMSMRSGSRVFKLAVESMLEDCQQVLAKAGLSPTDIDWLVPHQASFRIVRELGERLGVAESRRAWWLGELGNSSAATIAVALSLGRERGLIVPGQRLLLTAAGAGFCSAAALLQV
jgi:3-oxoacyl-[acyl-carrier-protein] synthase-3